DDKALLADLSRQTGRSMSALIRDAITRTYGQPAPADRAEVLRSVAGSWADRDTDGAAYVEDLRPGTRWQDLGL
ncbi:MAG: ribbon-helix-helix protein, CopG family, partial [Micrococcales bacterium]|nr:ribbon-helix-helix protein, CopG family [Micrococcales bacterium]